MSRPECSTQWLCELAHFDEGLELSWIDLVRLRRKDDRNPGIAAEFLIAQEVARTGAESLVRSELTGIDEDAESGDVTQCPARLDEREVAVVQVAHRWKKPDVAAS